MKKNILFKSLLIAIIALTVQSSVFSQAVVISESAGATADASAIMDIQSTTQGMLIPRLDRNDISNPIKGLLIYDNVDDAFFIYSGTDWLDLSSSADIWSQNASNVYLTNTTKNVGVGTSSSTGNFVIKGVEGDGADDVLFEVQDNTGTPIFKVTSSGVRIYVKDKTATKAVSGGFAVGQYGSLKATGDEFLIVTPDSTRVYTRPSGKAISGGFAVGQYTSLKAGTFKRNFYTNPLETRIYTGGSLAPGKDEKAVSGGFAVGQYGSLKAAGDDYMHMTPDNYFIGHKAGLATEPLNGGIHNIFVGFQSGLTNTSGHENTYVGHLSGENQIQGTDNVFLGNAAGQGLTSYTGTSLRNVILGAGAGRLLDDAIDNVFIGHLAGEGWSGPGVTGDYNVIIGESAGRHIVDAESNIFVGTQAGFSATSAWNNVFIGDSAGYKTTSGYKNVIIGSQAGANGAFPRNNVFIGDSAGFSNSQQRNIFIGNNAGRDNESGYNNVYIGFHSGMDAATGQYCTFVGNETGVNSSGYGNAFFGSKAGNANTEGQRNTFLGGEAGKNNTGLSSTSSDNVFVGNSAGAAHTTGEDNVYIGSGAADSDTDATGNVVVGQDAAGYGQIGNSNVYIGQKAGHSNQGSGNIFIGYNVVSGVIKNISNTLMIENSSNTSSPLIYGEFDNNIVRIGGTLHIGAVYSLPTSAGTSGQVLVTNGFGSQASWETMVSGLTAGNGLHITSSQVRLGGNLTENTTITQDGTETFTITNAGSGNTTINLSSSGDFDIQDNGTSAFFVGDIGNVGIGTNSPSADADLHVVKTAGLLPSLNTAVVGLFQQNSGSSNWSSVAIIGGETGASTLDFGDRYDQNSGNINYTHSDNSMRFTTNAGERMRIESGGDVGIGTLDPSQKLEIYGSSDNLEISNTAETEAGILFNDADDAANQYGKILFNSNGTTTNQLNFYVNNVTSIMTIHANGNVGIGTTNPQYKLHVEESSSAADAFAVKGDNTAQGCFAELGSGRHTGVGLYAEADQASESAVYGYNSAGGWAGYFDGQGYFSNKLGVGTTTPNASLDVNGSVSMNIGSYISSYTITDIDGVYTLLVANTITITLPTAADNEGRILIFQKISGNSSTVTIDGEGAELINGSSSISLVNMYTSYTLQSDGSRWRVIGKIL